MDPVSWFGMTPAGVCVTAGRAIGGGCTYFYGRQGHGNPMFNLTETQLATIVEDGHTLRIWRLWPDYNELIQEAQSCCAIRVLTEQQFTEIPLGIEISAN